MLHSGPRICFLKQYEGSCLLFDLVDGENIMEGKACMLLSPQNLYGMLPYRLEMES